MTREAQEKKIGEHNYRVRYWAPSKVIRHSQTLLKIILPPLSTLIESAGKGAGKVEDLLNTDISKINFSKAALLLVERWEDTQVEAIIDDLKAASEVETAPGTWPEMSKVYDLHFTGIPTELFGWVAFGLEVQFGDFFGGLRDKVAAVRGAMAQLRSKSPNTSVGPSGV